MVARPLAERPELTRAAREQYVEPGERWDRRTFQALPDPNEVLDGLDVAYERVAGFLDVPEQEPEQDLAVVNASDLGFVNPEQRAGSPYGKGIDPLWAKMRRVRLERLGVLESRSASPGATTRGLLA